MNDKKELGKRLSSPFTFYYKIVVPALSIMGFLVFILISFMHDAQVGYIFIGVLVIVFFLYSRFLFPLKHVWLSDDVLIVSSFSRQVRVPLYSITSVKEYKVFNPRRVVIKLRSDTEFGQKIIFTPLRDQKDIFRFMKDSAVTEVLKDRIKRAGGRLA